MSPRTAAWLAWSVCAASMTLLALSLLLILLGWSTPQPRGWVSWQAQAIVAVAVVGAPILGGLSPRAAPKAPMDGCG